MRIEPELKLDFHNVLIVPKRSELTSRSDVNLNRRIKMRHSDNYFDGCPVVVSNMLGTGTISMAKRLRNLNSTFTVALHKHYTPQNLRDFALSDCRGFSNAWYTIGLSDLDLESYCEFLESHPTALMLCVDVANGYTEKFISFIKKAREKVQEISENVVIMAGNVVTPEVTEALILAGADIVKIGIGSGATCTTRKVTGVGYPQLSAVVECADAAHGLGGHICSDGGCTCVGDVCKAFAAGADFVMLGGMFAGFGQCEQKVINGKVEFFGMSSDEAQRKLTGSVKDYRASEGKRVYIDYKGDVSQIVREIEGGLRSACTYVGAKTLKELPKRTTFIRTSMQTNEVFAT